MTFATNLQNAFTRVATEFKSIRTLISGSGTGGIAGLTTTDKSSLVAAINEAAQAGGATSLDQLSDVVVITPAAGQVLEYDGTQFANTALAAVATSGSAADLTGTLPSSVLPPLAVNDTFVVADQPSMLALTAQRGDVAIRTDVTRTYILTADDPTTLANWAEITAAGQVVSVNGHTGTVSLTKADIGLDQVDDTSDVNKPISAATQTALDAVGDTSTDFVTTFETALT